MEEERLYSAQQALKVVGVSRRRLDHSIREGYFAPHVESTGTGIKRGFSIDDLYLLSIAFAQVDSGFDVQQAFQFVEQYRDDLLDGSTPYMAVDRGVATVLNSPEEIVHFLDLDRDKSVNRPMVRIIYASGLREQIANRIVELGVDQGAGLQTER